MWLEKGERKANEVKEVKEVNEKPFASGQSHFHISTTAFARAPSGVRKDSAGFIVGVTSVNVVHSVAIYLLPWPALRL